MNSSAALTLILGKRMERLQTKPHGNRSIPLQLKIASPLDRLDVIVRPEEMNVPGFNFHPLRGFKPTRYSVHVNGPWCITFEFEEGDACRVDFEQYH